MRDDHRPYSLKILQRKFEAFWVDHFIRPQLDALGPHAMMMKPWFLKLYGRQISFGDAVHVIAASDRNVRLTTWAMHDYQGMIDIQNYVLICPGVRIDSASSVTIGEGTMLAAGAYLTDADWHDLYDRTQAIGQTAPIVLGNNVWIGDGATVCKGIHIGDNAVIGAGSVVTRDIPANVIAAGNPAQVIRELDASKTLVTRGALLADGPGLADQMDSLERSRRQSKSWWRGLRSNLAPSRRD